MRVCHAAACIEHGGDTPQLVIIGGLGAGYKILNDVWIMDVQSGRWKKVLTCLGYLLFIIKKLTFYVNISESVVAISIWGCNFWLQPLTYTHFQNLNSYTLHKPLLALNIIYEIYTHISCPSNMRFLALLICDFCILNIVKLYFTFNFFSRVLMCL